MITERELTVLAKQVVARLQSRRAQLVLAESCTAGLAAALLGRVPGVSEFFCGSAVVYQLATKMRWLRVPASLLRNPGPVSREVALEMAAGALKSTPHATIAAAVTGHLGPGAPQDQDGLVYLAIAHRASGARPPQTVVKKRELRKEPGDNVRNPERRRLRRQRSAAAHLLKLILDELPQISATSRDRSH